MKNVLPIPNEFNSYYLDDGSVLHRSGAKDTRGKYYILFCQKMRIPDSRVLLWSGPDLLLFDNPNQALEKVLELREKSR